jgi:hypothetical protein
MSWTQFSAAEPAIAQQGQELLYDVGVGLGFLATTRPDGGPRVHPVCPLISDEGLFVFVVPSPKQRDLHRDGRYALHTITLERNEDAFYLTGAATYVDNDAVRSSLGEQFAAERTTFAVPAPGLEQHLFELHVAMAMLTRTTGHGDPAPQHTIWHAPRSD